jgi:hypothetical protein
MLVGLCTKNSCDSIPKIRCKTNCENFNGGNLSLCEEYIGIREWVIVGFIYDFMIL